MRVSIKRRIPHIPKVATQGGADEKQHSADVAIDAGLLQLLEMFLNEMGTVFGAFEGLFPGAIILQFV